jgi:class 3 adenylate cyclase/tetratricopeptide (TPR) repeat protein
MEDNMECPKCQFENPDDANFCGKCREKLLLICPQCGRENSPENIFCNKCAQDLRKSEEALPVDYSEPQSYTPKHLKEKILTTRSSIEGERKLVTVFFADVANYTSMSEKLDPEEVHQIMDGCFKILMDEIHKYEGTINQFTGDGVMALFGAPVAHEDHAQRACYAALSVQKAIGEYEEKMKKDTGIEFKMRIGINSGHVIVGSIGDDLRMDYTAVGDTTNLASRMESAASPGNVLVSKNTHRLVKDFFEFEIPSEIDVKGKDELQEAYGLLRTSAVYTRFKASVAKGLTRFVGRKNSMPALMEVYEKAKSGSGQVVGIVGEAGVGKSRLLLEFRNRTIQDQYTYLEGRCLHYGGAMVYLPVLDILRSYFEIKEEDREYVIKKKINDKTLELDEKLTSVIPPFQDLLSLEVDDEEYVKLEPKQKREKTFEAIRDLLIRLSQDKPLVVAIEDLHWIDKTTEEFIDYLIGWLASSPILLILLYRPEYTHQWGSKSYYSKLGLSQLTPKSSAELVQAVLEEGEVAPELRDLILNRAAGNPLFMEEFTYTLLENGSIEKRDNQYVLSTKVSNIQVPDTIQGIIAARMDRLEDNLKRTMQVASVIGRDFAFRILHTVTGMREELKSYLLNLQGLEFIYEKSLFPELEYIFKHALTQEVAYNSLLQKRRKEIHEHIGKAIEQIYADRLEEFYEMLAYHYSKSETFEKAYQYNKLSGDKAKRIFSSFEAFGFYKGSLNILSRMDVNEQNKRRQIEVCISISDSLYPLGYPNGSLDMLHQGERLSMEIGDKKSLSILHSRMGHYFTTKETDALHGLEYIEKSFQEVEELQDIESMVKIGRDLLLPYATIGYFSRINDLAPKLITLLEGLSKEHEDYGTGRNYYSDFYAHYGFSFGWLGHFDKGEIAFEKGLAFARRINNLPSLGILEFLYALFFSIKGDWWRTIEHSQKAIQYLEESKFMPLLGLAWTSSGWGYYLLGELETARNKFEKGIECWGDYGGFLVLGYAYVLSSAVHSESGNFREAQTSIEEALEISRKNNEKIHEGMALQVHGRLSGRIDPTQFGTAEASVREGMKILEEFKIKPWFSQGFLYLGELYTIVNQKEKALEYLKKAESEFKKMGMDHYLATTYAVYAELFEKEGEQSKAKENLNKAIQIFKKCGADGWVKKYEKELAELS